MSIKQIVSYFLIFLFYISGVFAQSLTEAEKLEITKYLQLLDNYKTQNNLNQQLNYLNKVGNIYWNADMSNEAITYFSQAIPVSQSLGNKSGLIKLNNIVGYLYQDLEDYTSAQKYFQESLNISLTLSDKETISSNYMNLANAQYNQKKYDEAILSLKQSEILGLELNNKTILKKIYSQLAECYLANDNSSEYAKYFKLSENLLLQEKSELESDAIVSKLLAEKKSLKLIQQETKMKIIQDSLQFAEQINKKNQVEIELLNNEKKLKELEIEKKEAEVKEAEALLKKRNTIIVSFIIGLVIMTLFILIVFKLLMDKRKANKLLEKLNEKLHYKNEHINQKNIELQDKNIYIEKQNKELHTKNDQIEKQNGELKIKNTKIEEQRSLLEFKNNQITESINYASRIQKAILPSLNAILTSFKDAMIYYKPRDIVSGDFYWYSHQEDKKFLAAVDCTGHSVPGAFMSLIGNTLLNEIVNEKKIYSPAEILKKLHKGIIETLHQTDIEGQTTDDGMDITFCCYDEINKKVTFASANHQVYKFNKEGFEIIEGDIFSIGGYVEEGMDFSFTNHEISIDNQTVLYFFSDGYSDQFGGDFGKKFMSPQFEILINNIYKLPMKEQYNKLDETFNRWKGDRKQVDDILVVGIKF